MRHGLLLVSFAAACHPDDSVRSRDSVDLTWRPCRTWCEDLVDTYGALTSSDADPTGLPGWETGTWDPDAYLASCAAAPETDSCDLCTAFYFEAYLQPARIAGACDFRYRPGPAGAAALDAATLAAREAECAEACEDYGLDP